MSEEHQTAHDYGNVLHDNLASTSNYFLTLITHQH